MARTTGARGEGGGTAAAGGEEGAGEAGNGDSDGGREGGGGDELRAGAGAGAAPGGGGGGGGSALCFCCFCGGGGGGGDGDGAGAGVGGKEEDEEAFGGGTRAASGTTSGGGWPRCVPLVPPPPPPPPPPPSPTSTAVSDSRLALTSQPGSPSAAILLFRDLVAGPPRWSQRAESSSGEPTPRTLTAARMIERGAEEEEEEEGGGGEAGEGEVDEGAGLGSESSPARPPSFSCPKTSTETIEAGGAAAAGDERAFQTRPSSRAAFHDSGGVAPGPERR